MLDDAVVSLQQKARREFTHYLGEDVGNSVATAFDFQTNLNEGVIKGGIGALEDIQQLNPLRFAYDFDGAKETWGALAETAYYANPTTAIMDPQGAFEHGKEMLPGLVHAEDWTRDRPGLGLGEVVFDVGSAFTGAGAARTGTRAAGAVADAADEAAPGVRAAVVDNVLAETAPITGRAGSIADSLHDITDDIPTNAAPNPTRPAIPPSLVEPPPNAPMPHGVPESPAPDGPDSTGARVPDSTPLDRAAVGPAASAPVDLTPTSAE